MDEEPKNTTAGKPDPLLIIQYSLIWEEQKGGGWLRKEVTRIRNGKRDIVGDPDP
jgi:hypothetical protein